MLRAWLPLAPAALLLAVPGLRAAALIREPFAGVRHTHRTQSLPRPLSLHLLEIDLTHPAIRCLISPSNGAAAGESTPRTVRAFAAATGAQLAINASFFLASASGANFDNRGLVASAGDIYSPFDGDDRPWPVLNISAGNFAQIVSQAAQPSTGTAVSPPIPLHHAVSGNERIITDGRVTAGVVSFGEPGVLHPRTVAGLTADRRLVIMTVDGRQPGVSEGMRSAETAELLLQHGVTDAINLDGGGSTTLVFADPAPRVVNRLVGGERAVAASLGIFAAPATAPRDTLVYADFYAGDRGGFTGAPGADRATGLLAASTNTALASADAALRGWLQRLALRDDPAAAGGWSWRHAWAGAPAPARPATGRIGFRARTTTAGVHAALALDTARSTRQPLPADGRWHLREWDLALPADWETPPAGPFTLAAIQFSGPDADATIDLDLVAHNAHGGLAAELAPPETGRLANLSVRGELTAAEPTLILGLALAAPDSPVLVRAAGPALAAFGLAGLSSDPRLSVLSAAGAPVAANDDWGGAPALAEAAARVGAFPFAEVTGRDAAVLVPLAAGPQTVHATGSPGLVLVEAYDAAPASPAARLANLSVRARLGGAEPIVGGFVIAGGARRVLIRAIGPGLAPFGVAGAHGDPQLALFAGPTLHALNHDWGGGPALTDAFARAGAFALTATSRDAALLVTLPAGAYTAHVQGEGAGAVLLELYALP